MPRGRFLQRTQIHKQFSCEVRSKHLAVYGSFGKDMGELTKFLTKHRDSQVMLPAKCVHAAPELHSGRIVHIGVLFG